MNALTSESGRQAEDGSLPDPAEHSQSSEIRAPSRIVDRYALYGEIASGGMATVHLGRLLGPVGFTRTVAVKCLHPHYAKDPEFVSMFLDEARLAARVRHPNVVSTIDVVVRDGELFLVMEYVAGESLSKLLRVVRARDERVPLGIATTIAAAMLHGLHAAHEAVSDRGDPLGLVHRDVSPQNVIVGTDGIARVIDFGVAKAQGRVQTTREGQVKGKIAYMAPEQLLGDATRRADIYAAGLVLWELIAGRRAFQADTEPAVMARVLHAELEAPSVHVGHFADAAWSYPNEAELLRALDVIVMRAVNRDPDLRFDSAEEMALAIEAVVAPIPARDIGAWVASVGSDTLAAKLRVVAEIESASAMVPVSRVEGSDAAPADVRASRRPSSSYSHGASLRMRELEGVTDVEVLGPERTPPAPVRGMRWLVAASAGLVAALVVGAVMLKNGAAPARDRQSLAGAGAGSAASSSVSVDGGVPLPGLPPQPLATTSAQDEHPEDTAATAGERGNAGATGSPGAPAEASSRGSSFSVVRPGHRPHHPPAGAASGKVAPPPSTYNPAFL